MKSSITASQSKERVKELTEEFKHSSVLRERLIQILRQKNESNRAVVRSKVAYDSPSWAYTQADAIGYERAIYELIALLSNDSVEKTSETK